MLMMSRIFAFGAGSGISYKANAVNFNGSTYLYTGAFTGEVASKVFSLSAWVYSNYSVEKCILQGIPYGVTVAIGSGNDVVISAYNNAGLLILSGTASSAFNLNEWFHLGISFDLSDTSKRVITINGIAQSITWSAYTNDNIPYDTVTKNTVGAYAASYTSILNGRLCDLWQEHGGSFIDFSDASNYANFVRDGKPVSLGGSGNSPTGITPICCLSDDTATWHTNKGSGGGFTEYGSLTTATTSPSD